MSKKIEPSDIGAEKFIEFGNHLLAKRIRSISPQTGTLLIEIKTQVDAEIGNLRSDPASDPLIIAQMERYSEGLKEIIVVSALHQKMILTGLGSLIASLKEK